MSIHQHNFGLPRLPITSQQPSELEVDREMEGRPGLGRLQAYRQVQMRMAFKSMVRTSEGSRWLAEREARRHEGC